MSREIKCSEVNECLSLMLVPRGAKQVRVPERVVGSWRSWWVGSVPSAGSPRERTGEGLERWEWRR